MFSLLFPVRFFWKLGFDAFPEILCLLCCQTQLAFGNVSFSLDYQTLKPPDHLFLQCAPTISCDVRLNFPPPVIRQVQVCCHGKIKLGENIVRLVYFVLRCCYLRETDIAVKWESKSSIDPLCNVPEIIRPYLCSVQD